MTKRASVLKLMSLLGLFCMGALVLAVSCSTGGSGRTTGGEATELVNDAHVAYRAADWATYASWLHPEALTRFESILRPIVESSIQVDSTGEVADKFQWLGQTYDTQEFMDMSPADFFAFSMNEIITAVPALKQAMGTATIKVLGEMPEGDTLVHVVVRTSAESMGIGMSEVSVLTTKKYETAYRLMLPGQIEGLITAIAQNMQQR